MIDDLVYETSESNVLYELLIYAEWQREPEIQARGSVEKSDDKRVQGSMWGWLGPLAPSSCPPTLIQKLTNLQMPWQFAVGGDGKVVAILLEQSLEIRSMRDEFGSVIGRSPVVKDSNPQWRKLLWSPDCTMLALGHSSGSVDFFDLIGAHLFTIHSKIWMSSTNGSHDSGLAIAGMVFSDVQVQNTQWSYEFSFSNYRGKMSSYFVSCTDGFQEKHSFMFSPYYSNGITAMCYHQLSNILLVSGNSQKFHVLDASSKAFQLGISAWRVLADYPYYKLVTSLEDDMVSSRKGWFQFLQNYRLHSSALQDTVYKMCISPNGSSLAAIHTSGALSLWDLPTLRLKKFWDLQLQPNYTDINPQYCEPGMKRKAATILSDSLRFHIIDINWWSEEAVILVRCCGAVTISSVHSLKNLLGISPEWFEPSTQVSPFYDRGFLAMECESRISTKKRPASDTYEHSDGDDSSDDEEYSVFTKSAEIAKRMLYFITDSEKFQPPRKKPKIVNKTYRLLCLKSTTPEELYTRKINNEEYGEALALAKTYSLDCDLVYQRQWRKTPVSVASIQDYLSKITKRSWVLHECLERVPENIDATRELLMYGLSGTDLEALIAIGKGEDHGRFIVSQSSHYWDNSYNLYNLRNEGDAGRNKEEKEKRKHYEMMKQINFKRLTLEQKQICQCRLRLLTYLDRLSTYEIILGGPGIAEELYDHNFFKLFRIQSGLEACISFARNSNWRAVAAMFTYHGEETLPHRLPILSNFPEIISPLEYQSLLPKISYAKDDPVYPWNEEKWRKDDWCETKYPRQMISPLAEDYVVEFYEEHKELLKYREKLNSRLLTDWFSERAQEIENRSNLVDNAFELIKLGIERNVKGLDKLFNEFVTLETLVYDCRVDDVSFKSLRQMDDFKKVQLLMSKNTEKNFIKNVGHWLMPFLERCESHEPGKGRTLLKRYLVSIVKEDLSGCRKIFENSKPGQPEPIISNMEELVSLVLHCLYSCERIDQLQEARMILDCIQPPLVSTDHPGISSLSDQIDVLERHFSIAEILENNGTPVSLGCIKECYENADEVKKLLIKLTRVSSRRSPPLNEDQWKNLLNDILKMQMLLFKCVAIEDCYEIFLQSLLCSGRQDTISLAGRMMIPNQKQWKGRDVTKNVNMISSYKISYSRSVNLVLSAAQEHFNSSANVSDPCMALARQCLNLIEDVPAVIEEELNLIASLPLLQEFNVNILPLQVRLCEDKIYLIQQALRSKPKAYKKAQKLLQLAYLLHVSANDKKSREGKVLTLVAEAAFNNKDYESCLSVCHELIGGGHSNGWSVCYSLGGCADFNNIPASKCLQNQASTNLSSSSRLLKLLKMMRCLSSAVSHQRNIKCDLMSFSLAHCSPDLIESILKSKIELQLQAMYDRVKFLMGDGFMPNTRNENGDERLLLEDIKDDNSEAFENSKNAIWHTGEKTLQVLQTTTKTTKAVLTSVGKTKFWKDAVRWIHPLGLQWYDHMSDDGDEYSNKDLTKQGTCAFYADLINNAHISKLEASYQRYARPDPSQSLEITTSILRASLLEDTLKFESKKIGVSTSVILDLAKACIPEDAILSMTYLLCLKKADDAEEVFRSLPSTPIVFHFASVYYAIRICMSQKLPILFSTNGEVQLDPSNIIREVVDQVKLDELSASEKENGVQNALELLFKFNKMLYDFIQAEVLHSIGGGVDAIRFAEDDVYKNETILGIAMTLDDNVFSIAISLANHYKLPLWDVYMVHLEYLFSDDSLSPSTLQERIENLKLLDVLIKQKEKFKKKLIFCIYPNIDGKNHAMLLLYYSLLKESGDHCDTYGIHPSEHLKIIKKFRTASPNLNYKLLLDPSSSRLAYISTLLNEANVHIFAKVTSKLPVCNGIFLSPSSIYCAWIKKYFFERSGPSRKAPETTFEWLHHYETCGNIMHRLSPSDTLEFINYITFTETALERFSIDCRVEITKQALKYSREKSSKSKDDKQSFEWKTVTNTLSENLLHLQRLEDNMVFQFRNSADLNFQAYAKEFDLSRCIPEKLKDLVIKVVLKGEDLSLLQTVISICPSNFLFEPSDVYMEAVHLLLRYLKHPDIAPHPYLKKKSCSTILESVLEDIFKYKDNLMIEDMAVELLHAFCTEKEIPVSVKLSVLQILEKITTLSNEHIELLLLYRTQALVSSLWPEFEVTEENVKQEDQRNELFDRLLKLSSTVHHFGELSELLYYWPSFESSLYEDPLYNPWTKLLCSLAALPNQRGLSEIIRLLDKAQTMTKLNEECCLCIYQEVAKHCSIINNLKFALKTEYSSLHDKALESIAENTQTLKGVVDDELLDVILKQHVTAKLVKTSLYEPVIEFLLNHQDECCIKDYLSVDNVIKELVNAGYNAEAGSLLMIIDGTHSGLSTFKSAFSVLQRWLSASSKS